MTTMFAAAVYILIVCSTDVQSDQTHFSRWFPRHCHPPNMNHTDPEDDPMNPPPIVTYNVDTDDDTARRVLKRMLKYQFSLRRHKDALYIYTHSRDDYDTLIKFLQFHDHGYSTYRPPWDDTRLMVLKNYLGDKSSTLVADLKAKGFTCLDVHIINRRPQEATFPARLLTLAGDTDVDRLRRLNYLGKYGGFTWSEYTSDKYTPVQCHRCQRFRHDSRFCHMPPNCRHCAQQHSSDECKRKSEDPLKCFNCEGKHRADSADCPEWIAYKEGLASAKTKVPAKRPTVVPTTIAAKSSPSVIALANHVDAMWNLARDLGVESMCFDYETTSITMDYGPIPKSGMPSPIRLGANGRPFKFGLRRSNKSVIV